jgi:hypothetical protein
MPNVLEARTVETLRQYMELVETLMEPKEPLWFRGNSCSSNALVPTLYRHPEALDVDQLLHLEEKVIQRFRERGAPYEPFPTGDTWELLFLMQHFGVPTRLLDWTENPYIGLFFALTSRRIVPNEPASVWILQPQAWNKAALSEISYDEGILSIGNKALDSYRPSADPQFMRVAPVGMYGIHNSPRIVAQRGVFTIFGKDTTPLESLFQDGEFPSAALMRADFPSEAIPSLRESLFSIGITDSVVYPDLSGLAVELKRYFGFEV